MKQFNTEHINSIRNDLRLWFGSEWANSFDKSKDKARWFRDNQDALLTNDQFVRNYDIDALQGVYSKAMESIYNRYPDYSKLTENQIKRFESSSNQSREELKKYYKFREDQKKAVNKFNDERYKEIEATRKESERAKEFDDSFYNKYLGNEYAREHYIKGHPIQARINEIAGKAAGIADFLPAPLSLGGPAIRSAQKWAADKDVMTVGTAMDLAGAFIPDAVEKPAKFAWQYLKQGKFGKYLEAPWAKQLEARIKKSDNKAAQEAANDIKLTKGLDVDKLTDEQIENIYKQIKTPEIKKSIEDYWKAKRSVDEARQFAEMPNGIAEAIAERELPATEDALITAERKADYLAKVNKPLLEVRSRNLPKDQPLMVNGDFNTYYKDVPLKDIIDYRESQVVPNLKDEALYQILKLGGRKAARATIGAHKWDEINYKPNYNEDKAINEIINMYSDDWKYGKPSNYNDPLIKAAYDKWLDDQYRKGNYDVLYRMGEIK